MAETKTAKIFVSLEDKVGLGPPTYSSVTMGASVSREVADPGGDEGLTFLKTEMDKLAKEVVEPFIATERAKVLKWLQREPEDKSD